MKFALQQAKLIELNSDAIVVAAFNQGLSASATQIDHATKGHLKALFKSGDIRSKLGSVTTLHDLPGVLSKRIIIIGCGDKDKIKPCQFKTLFNQLFDYLRHSPIRSIGIDITDIHVEKTSLAWRLQQAAQILVEKSYQFSECKSEKPSAIALKDIQFVVTKEDHIKAHKLALEYGAKIGGGMNFAKHLGDLPANICTPTYLATTAKKLASSSKKFKFNVMNEASMKKLGMHSLLSVSHGSIEPAQLITLEYHGAKNKSEKPIVLVGKGITFDSGGISLKGGAGMDEMKFDMCGAASVLGTLNAIAQLDLAVNVIGVIAASENMPSGSATKPGDIVKSMAGITIEILNTDAEGRLVLCDALTYVKRFKPAAVIDIATLTGAMVVALGHFATGVMGNNDELIKDIIHAGQSSHDRAWQLPIWDDYQTQLESNFADMANIGGKSAGSITAACFLSRFTKDYPWAHLDIAGTAWDTGKAKGSTGRPVPLLTQFIIDRMK